MKNILTALLLISFNSSIGQVFIDRGIIEYEVKTNIKKTMGNSSWAESMKEKLPQFKTGYYNLAFTPSASIYKFAKWEDNSGIPEYMKKSEEDNSWFINYENHSVVMQKNIFGTILNISDNLKNIKWKLTNESREIAGFSCRKAVGIIFDSVYVFAFYTDGITVSGGPCSINGLPGMILGMTIPRLYTSWIATKVNTYGVKENEIKMPSAKKGMKYYEIKKVLDDRLKEWVSDDEDDKKWAEQMLWQTFL